MSESGVPQLPRGALANALTLLRLVLVPPVVLAIVQGSALLALVLLLLAVATDGLDGHLARRYGSTPLGSWLGVVADRILIAAVTGALWWVHALPFWIVVVLVAREALIAAGALAIRSQARRLEPLLIGKVYAASVFLLLLLATAEAAGLVPARAIDLLAWPVAGAAVLSGLAYARRAMP